MNGKRLYLSRQNRMLTGVCGGIAEYLNVDPTIVRLITVVAVPVLGTGLFAYIIATLIIPEGPI